MSHSTYSPSELSSLRADSADYPTLDELFDEEERYIGMAYTLGISVDELRRREKAANDNYLVRRGEDLHA